MTSLNPSNKADALLINELLSAARKALMLATEPWDFTEQEQADTTAEIEAVLTKVERRLVRGSRGDR